MKICPTCRKTYTDENLNFCLDDGTVLTYATTDAPPTIMMQQPPPTNPNPSRASMQSPTMPQGGHHPGIQTSWDAQSNYSVQPKKSSKSWLWIVGILGLVVLFCGGGIVGLGILAYIGADNSNDNVVNSSTPTPRPASPTPPSDGRTSLQTISLSGWVQSNSAYGNTEFTDGELIMSSKQKGYYYVLVAQRDYSTENANTRVTVRNVDNADSTMGYGLVFHSNPTPLQQGYAFLIDSKKGRYRVVRHIPQDEPVVVSWTNAKSINSGAAENVLEVRDKAGSIDLYINDQKVTTIKNSYGYKGGVPGLYSGDGVRAAFSKLEIRK